MARSHPTADLLLRTHIALGRAQAATGHREEALASYRSAARTLDDMGSSLEADLDRARFRDRNLDPLDEAMRLLLEAEPPDAIRLLEWNQRRKSAALGGSIGRVTGSADRAGSALGMHEIRRRLESREALLDYIVLPTTVAVLVVTREQATTVVLPILPGRLAKLVDQVRGPLSTSYAGRVDLARAPFDTVASRDLYEALLAPVDDVIGTMQRLVVVPDGPLHALPFDALAIDSGEAVVDRFEVLELPSTRFLGGMPRNSGLDRRSPILVMAGTAPGANDEVLAIRASWSVDRVVIHDGDDATEGVMHEAARFPIVHFATHAVADARDPLASFIRLAPGGGDDGFLHAEEVTAARIPFQLVVLSACETSTGRPLRGEGLMSLGRAFLAGGAHQVIGTLWPVGAASAEFMGAFYARLAAGLSPATALRAAKLQVRRNPATAHPFFWAGFVHTAGTAGPS